MININSFSSLPAPLKIMLLGILVLFGMLAGTIISFIIIFLIKGASVTDLQDFLANTDSNILTLKLLQIVNHLFMFIIPALLFAFLMQRDILKYHQMKRPVDKMLLFKCFLLIILSIPLVGFLLKINEGFSLPEQLSGIEKWMRNSEEKSMILTEKFLNVSSIRAWLLNIFIIAVIPAFSEELFFRGALQRILHDAIKRQPWIPIVLSGIIFSAFHLQFYGFLPRMYLGMLFAYIFWTTKNLWYPIVLHFINNAFTVTLYFLINRGIINDCILNSEVSFHYLPLIISTLVVVALLYRFKRYSKQQVFA